MNKFILSLEGCCWEITALQGPARDRGVRFEYKILEKPIPIKELTEREAIAIKEQESSMLDLVNKDEQEKLLLNIYDKVTPKHNYVQFFGDDGCPAYRVDLDVLVYLIHGKHTLRAKTLQKFLGSEEFGELVDKQYADTLMQCPTPTEHDPEEWDKKYQQIGKLCVQLYPQHDRQEFIRCRNKHIDETLAIVQPEYMQFFHGTPEGKRLLGLLHSTKEIVISPTQIVIPSTAHQIKMIFAFATGSLNGESGRPLGEGRRAELFLLFFCGILERQMCGIEDYPPKDPQSNTKSQGRHE